MSCSRRWIWAWKTASRPSVGLLSGGQRQALTLLMATMNNPKLLLLDEHTAALDPKTAAQSADPLGQDRGGKPPDHA